MGRLAGHRGQDSPQYDSTSPQAQSQPEEDDEAEEDEAEELGHAETYADYVPSKCECPAMETPSCTVPGSSGLGCPFQGSLKVPGNLKLPEQVWVLRVVS